MKNNKSVLITIIVLLCVFFPLTIVGFIFKDDKNLLDENPAHDTFYKGHIWFYDNNDKFLSKYECQTEICNFTTPIIDDTIYGLNYYKNGTMTKAEVVDNIYTFITDGVVVYLYNVSNGTTLTNYKAIKNYNTKLENNAYIIQNSDGLWGVLTIGQNLNRLLPFEYDFIGLTNNVNDDGTVSTNKFIVLKDSKWYIVDNTNNFLTGAIDDPIVDYTSEYVFSKSSENIKIYSYQNYEYLTNYQIKDYILEDKYLGIITDKELLIYENLGVNYLKNISLTNIDGKITLEKTENKLSIKVNNEEIESIELN